MNSSTSRHAGCSGFRAMPRRRAIQAGVLGALGLSMGDLFRLQAADKVGMTSERVRQLEVSALEKLRERADLRRYYDESE